jgi:1-deoxy-D-xylulose-5-phosphate synthase
LDQKLILDLAKNHKFLITLEEGAIGGFGSAITQFLLNEGAFERQNFKFRAMFMKDQFVEQNNISVMQDEAGIGVKDIVELILNSNL